MRTTTEVHAEAVLKQLGFKRLIFIDREVDYSAIKDRQKAWIEVKSDNDLRMAQMKKLAEERSKGDQSYILFVSVDGKYCLFQLVSTNLANSPPIEDNLGYHTLKVNALTGEAELYCPETKETYVFTVHKKLRGAFFI